MMNIIEENGVEYEVDDEEILSEEYKAKLLQSSLDTFKVLCEKWNKEEGTTRWNADNLNNI